MKPIGIGKLNKAKRKTMSRHEFAPQKNETSPSQTPSEEVEGQLSVDVYQTATELIIMAPVAGTAPEDLHISITDDVITIRGERTLKNSESLNADTPYLQECFWGKFSRSIVLPDAVDTSRVEARFKHNIVTIRIPKIETTRTKVIKIEQD